MKTLKTVERRVTEILREHPDARNDDMRLYLLVSQSCIYETHGIGTEWSVCILNTQKTDRRIRQWQIRS